MRSSQQLLKIALVVWITVTTLGFLLYNSVSFGASSAQKRSPAEADPHYAMAVALMDEAMIAGDDSATSHWLSGCLLLHQGQWEAARQQLRVVLETTPYGSRLDVKARQLLAATSPTQTVTLAFDDFPFPDSTPRLLALLAEHQVPVTFFAIGNKVKRYPELVREALARGHTVHNHSYDNRRLTDLSAGQAQEEVRRCSQVLYEVTGTGPRFLRCPGAHCDEVVWEESQRCGLVCIDSIATEIYDMDVPASVIRQRCAERVEPGAILTLHDGVPATLEALPQIITDLRERGYEFVTVDELLGWD